MKGETWASDLAKNQVLLGDDIKTNPANSQNVFMKAGKSSGLPQFKYV